MPPKRKSTTESRGAKRTRRRRYGGDYSQGTIFNLGDTTLSKKEKVRLGRLNQETERAERKAYEELSEDFRNFANNLDITRAETEGYLPTSTRDMPLSLIMEANAFFAKVLKERDEQMKVGIPVELPEPPTGGRGKPTASSIPPTQKERPKVTKGHADSLNKVADIVKKHPPFSEVIFSAIQQGISYFTGSPWAGEVTAGVLRTLWSNRSLLKRGFDKVVGFIRRLRRGGDPEKLVPQIEAAPQAITSVSKYFGAKKTEAQEALTTRQGIRKTVRDFLHKDNAVALALFEKPNPEKVLEILSNAAKEKGIPMTEGMVETCKALIEQDKDLNEQLSVYTEVRNKVIDTTKVVGNAIYDGDLVSISTAIGGLRTVLDKYSNLALIPSNVITDGLSYMLTEAGNRMKALIEQRQMAADKLRDANRNLEAAKDEQNVLQKRYNALVKQQQDEHQHINEEKDALIRRNDEISGALEEMRQKYKAAEEKRLEAEAHRNSLELQLREMNDAARNQIAILNNLQSEKDALSVAGENQMTTLNSLQLANIDLTNKNNTLIGLLDANKAKIQELMQQSSEAILKLKEKESTIVVNEKRIGELEGQITKLEDQISNLKELEQTSNALVRKKAEEVIQAQVNGDTALAELRNKYEEEAKRARGMVQSYRHQIEIYEKSIAQTQSKWKALVDENKRYKAEIDSNANTIESGRKALEDAEEITHRLQMKQDFWKAEIDKLQKSNSELEQRLLDYAEYENSMKISLLNAEEQNTELVTQEQQLRLDLTKEQRERLAERKRLEAQITKKDAEITRLKQDLEKQNKTIQESKDAIGHNIFSKGWNWLFHHSKQKKAKEDKSTAEKQSAADRMEIENNEDERNKLQQASEKKLQEAQEQLQFAQRQIWRVIRGEVLEQGQALRKVRGGILTPTAPDWNLQPNDKIAKFWSDFYTKSFHLF